jgi:large subunit ribosomal protein L1
VKEFKAGKVEFRADATGIVHALVGKLSLSDEQLAANIEAFINHIRTVKPASVKGQYVRSITISATMSPGVPIIAA